MMGILNMQIEILRYVWIKTPTNAYLIGSVIDAQEAVVAPCGIIWDAIALFPITAIG
jgi:hypothetical protein